MQGSPHPILADEPAYTEQYRAVGIERVRIDQDCLPNTLTLGGIFPDEHADPAAPGSYRFAAIDAHLAAARAAGCDVLWQASYDVGGSDHWDGLNLGGRPPADLDRWGRVVERCLAHFVDGWASGLDRAVRWVEFLNEPNGLGGFRGPDASRLVPAFLRFLEVVEGFGRAHPDRPVRAVGPGIPLSLAEWPAMRAGFARGLAAVRDAGRTLPIFSFHTYGADVSPVANAKLAREFRALLDEQGFRDSELWNSEWLAGEFLSKHLGIDRARARDATPAERSRFASALAAYAIACKLRWQGVVSGSFYYRGNHRAFPEGQGTPFGETGPGHFFTRDGGLGPLAFSESLTRLAARTTPERCATSWDDDGLLTALGLCSGDGRVAALLASNLSISPRHVVARFSGLPEDGAVDAEVVHLEAETRALRPAPLAPARATGGAVEVGAELGPLSSLLLFARLVA